MSLMKIKARLGSLSPARLNEMPISAQRLLEVDMPVVLDIAAAAERLKADKNNVFAWEALFQAFERLEE